MRPQGFSTEGLVTLAVDLPGGVMPIGWIGRDLVAHWREQDRQARWQDGRSEPTAVDESGLDASGLDKLGLDKSGLGESGLARIGPTGAGFRASCPRLVVRPSAAHH